MSKKNIVKILLDVVMTGILVLLYNSHVFALAFHEIAGLILSGLFIVHCLFNKKWITSITTKFFKKGLAPRVRVGYIVNTLLLIAFVFIIISGIKTSQVLFPAAVENKGSIWRGIHHFSAAISIILVGVHIGLHWSFVSGMWKKVSHIPAKVTRPISIILLIVVLSFGSYSIASSSFLPWLAEPFTSAGSHSNQTEQFVPGEEATTENDIVSEDTEKTEDESKSAAGDYNNHPPKSGENKDVNQTENPGTATTESSRHPEGEKKSESGGVSVIANTVATHLSIMSVFAAIAYYLEKLLNCFSYMYALQVN